MKILNLDNWCDEAEGMLKPWLGDHKWKEAEGLIVSLESGLPPDYLIPNIKFIASCTTGLDHIDLEYCKAKGIKVISLQGEPILKDVYATAEHTWALIMALIRKVPWAFDDVKQGNWNREAWQGTELRGKTLGIVGFGRIGQQVAKIAEAFGMRVIKHDKTHGYRLEPLLRDSDIVTVHVPLNEETKGMFGIEQFKLMKPTAYFINTSRGAVIYEGDLLRALSTNVIAGAALDVVLDEPNIWPMLYKYEKDNLIITPHIGGNTAESRKKTQIYIANKIKEYINEL